MPVLVFGRAPGSDVLLGHKDTYINGGATNRAYGSEVQVGIEQFMGSIIYAGLLRFDLTSIPTNATVTAAVLSLKTVNAPANCTVSVRPMATNWGITDTDEGLTENPASAGQATYDHASDHGGAGDTNWANPAGFAAGDYGAQEATYNAAAGEPAGTEHIIAIPIMAQNWITTPANNAGILLMSTTNNATWVGSQENATAARRPTLTIDYTVPTPPTPTPTGRSVAAITKDFARMLFSPLMQSGKGYLVVQQYGISAALIQEAVDASTATDPSDTAEDTAKRLWMHRVFLSKVHPSVQVVSGQVLSYMGGGGTRMILSGSLMSEGVRYSQE